MFSSDVVFGFPSLETNIFINIFKSEPKVPRTNLTSKPSVCWNSSENENHNEEKTNCIPHKEKAVQDKNVLNDSNKERKMEERNTIRTNPHVHWIPPKSIRDMEKTTTI